MDGRQGREVDVMFLDDWLEPFLPKALNNLVGSLVDLSS